nr:immunoglobulin light chain junction region [Macaca mulatta]MOV73373.1 immunoglobulin light chain junction region [Macaca mulatta]
DYYCGSYGSGSTHGLF